MMPIGRLLPLVRAAFVTSVVALGACQMDVGGSGTSGPSGGASEGNSPTSTNSNTPAATGPTKVQGVRMLGRVPSSNVLSWPGSGLTFEFNGSQAVIKFSQVNSTNYFALTVDNGEPNKIMVSDTSGVTIGKLTNGNHNVTLVKLNEASLGTLTYGSVTSDGSLGSVYAPARRIEYIGDSITVGYGADGNSPCTNTAALEDAAKTYGALTATALGADYSLIAWSGKGLTRNTASTATDTSALMPDIWTRYGALDNSGTYTFPAATMPQVVVINLGTNDFSYIGYDSSGTAEQVRSPIDPATFESAYVAFLKQVREKYPSAHIVLCSSPMLSDTYPTAADAQHSTQLAALKSVVTSFGDSSVSVVDFPAQQVGTGINGCDSHPSLAEHQAMAAILTPAIKAAMGW